MGGNVFGNIFGMNVATINSVQYSVSNVTPDSYTIVLPTASNVTTITRGGGGVVTALKDVQYDAIYPAVSYLSFAGTQVSLSAKTTASDYSVSSAFTELNKDTTTEFTSTRVIPCTTNVVNNLGSASPFRFRIALDSDNENVSPLIDMDQTSVVLVKNRVNSPTYSTVNTVLDITTVAQNNNISFTKLTSNTGLINFVTVLDRANVISVTPGTTVTVSGTGNNNGTFRVLEVLGAGSNISVFGNVITEVANALGNVVVTNGTKFIAEEAARSGSAIAKYITKRIDFTSPSTSINLRMDVSKPVDSDVKVYYKSKLVGEAVDINTKEYVELPGIVIPTALGGEYAEVEKQVDNLPRYESLIIKIVLLSSNSAAVPKVKNLRIIALE
jgi:hypothetical protein